MRTKKKNTMQKNTIATKNYTLTFTKEIGKLWILKDFAPLGKNFARFFDENLGHDIGKLMTVGCPNYVLDTLADGQNRLEIDLRIAAERVDLPGYVEFERVDTGSLSAKYHVNNCPGKPQLEAWVSNTVKAFLKEYPAFAYIKKI